MYSLSTQQVRYSDGLRTVVENAPLNNTKYCIYSRLAKYTHKYG